MDTWLAVLVVIIVVCIKYVWDIPTEDRFPYKILYRCVYLYGVISYTAARMMSYVNGKNFAENYRTFLTVMIPTAKEAESTTSDVLIKTTEFDGIEVRQYQNVRLTGDGERPALLFIHGGGYVLSSPGVYDDLLKLICRDLGYYVAQIHYTLAPEGKFPRAYNDCLTACLWFFRNSERFSVNPHRIVISGDSMGGQIAASVVQALCKDPTIPKPRAQVLMYPCLQFLDMRTPSYQRTRWLHGERPGILNHITVSLFLSFYLFGREDTRFVNEVSGNSHVPNEFRKSSACMKRLNHDFIPGQLKFHSYNKAPENDKSSHPKEEQDNAIWEENQNMLLDYRLCPMMGELEGLPKAYVITCGVDVFRDDAIMYCSNLRQANVPAIHKHYQKSFHGAITFPKEIIPSACEMRDDLLEFLRKEI